VSKFRNSRTRDVIDVPDVLDGRYNADPEWAAFDPDQPTFPEVHPQAYAPAGATGDPVPAFDAEQPLSAGPRIALDNIEDIKGAPLDESLKALGLDTKGNADEKRTRLADRLNEEINDG
jgi:hypothetical protein